MQDNCTTATHRITRETVENQLHHVGARLIIAGGVVDVVASTAMGHRPDAVKIDADTWARLSTGEVIDVEHTERRIDNIKSLRSSMARLRGLINANFGTISPLDAQAWLTLTYRDNVRDEDRVERDWQAFIRFVRRTAHADIDYIMVIEPQRRGAWHMHALLLRADGGTLYIPQNVLLEAWRAIVRRSTPEGRPEGGGVNIHRLEGIDNIGAYLSAYLCDEDGSKGARLHLYPTGMHYYRTSSGINRPETIEFENVDDAKRAAAALTGSSRPHYNKTEVISLDGEPVQAVQRLQYKQRIYYVKLD